MTARHEAGWVPDTRPGEQPYEGRHWQVTSREELERAIWEALHELEAARLNRRGLVTVLLDLADSYASGDSERLAELRRQVLHRESAPLVKGAVYQCVRHNHASDLVSCVDCAKGAMTGLSRCGRKYQTFEAALLAAELRTSKGAKPLAVVSCALGSHWHLVPPGNVTGNGSSRPDPFPPPVRLLLARRDECCQRCGKYGVRLEAHHRRAKASGGSSARSHTQCACNGVMLCRACHEWVHSNPRKARVEGWIVLQSVSKPGTVGVDQQLAGWRLVSGYPTCEGGWNDQS